MTDTSFDLSIFLRIETNIAPEDIVNLLNVSPTAIIPKGDHLFAFVGKVNNNIIIYENKYRSCQCIGNRISNFFEEYQEITNKIDELRKFCFCSLRLSIISDYAQIGLSLSPEDLQLLNKFNLPFEISVLSWGGCMNN